MSKLDKWLPFKFKKKSRKEKQQEPQAPAAAPLAPAAPQGSLTPYDSLFTTPMQQLMRGFFQDPFFREPFADFGRMDRWFGDFSPRHFSPSIEVSDDDKNVKVTAELPGMEKDDVKLHIDDSMLVISGEKKSESESTGEGTFRTERFYGYFQRPVPLPEDVDHEKAEAAFKKGVLTVRFPKQGGAKARTRQIEIKE